MDFSFIWKGLILGFAIAAPVGPIGILCIRRTLQFGRFSGLFSGLGAAAADMVYAIIAAFGLTFISNVLIAGRFWMQLIGGLFLLYLGWKTYFSPVCDKTGTVSHTSLWNDFVSTFFLTITNPMTILSFLAIFAGFGLSVRLPRRLVRSAKPVAGSRDRSCLGCEGFSLDMVLAAFSWRPRLPILGCRVCCRNRADNFHGCPLFRCCYQRHREARSWWNDP